MKINKGNIIALTSIISYFLVAKIVMAAHLSKWASPPKPGGVLSDVGGGLSNLTNWILGLISIIAVLMIIWGGILYLISGGDENRIEEGKKTLAYAIMGLIIAGLAYGIEKVITSKILTS